MGYLRILGMLGIFEIFMDFKEFRDFLGFLGIFGICRDFRKFRDFFGIFRDFREFRDFFGIFDGNMLVRLCRSNYGCVKKKNADVSSKVEFLSKIKARICGFLKIYDGLLDDVEISRHDLVRISEN